MSFAQSKIREAEAMANAMGFGSIDEALLCLEAEYGSLDDPVKPKSGVKIKKNKILGGVQENEAGNNKPTEKQVC